MPGASCYILVGNLSILVMECNYGLLEFQLLTDSMLCEVVGYPYCILYYSFVRGGWSGWCVDYILDRVVFSGSCSLD